MPYKSLAQNRYIHMMASRGEHWAEKFVKDSHGTKVPRIQHVAKKVKRKRRRRVRRRR